ncbi:MAG: SDR family oxidoreductase [Cyanobacteria bacterium TGS_CYA1]|nr:SDR family oxidoreductase [Cyanobacteria bacterium TGS_CYA1]
MDFGIKHKHALICGASKGIGRAIAKELCAEGVKVFLCARTKEVLSETAETIKKDCPSAEIYFQACDLSSPDDRKQLIASVKEKLGSIDIVVHNTGGPKTSKAEDTKIEDWDSGFKQLFLSVADINNAFLPSMKERKWGRIVCVTSLSIMEPIANLSVSNAVRSAVTAMLKTLSDEVAPFNITVNCVAPGAIETDRLQDLMEQRTKASGQSKEEYQKQYVAAIPAGRMGTPEEFAAVTAFLCSQRASYVTGSTICVDGGKRRSTY